MAKIDASVLFIDDASRSDEDPKAKIEYFPGKLKVYYFGEESVFVRTNSFYLFGIYAFLQFVFTGCYLYRTAGIRRLSDNILEVEPFGRFEFRIQIDVDEPKLLNEIEDYLGEKQSNSLVR